MCVCVFLCSLDTVTSDGVVYNIYSVDNGVGFDIATGGDPCPTGTLAVFESEDKYQELIGDMVTANVADGYICFVTVYIHLLIRSHI